MCVCEGGALTKAIGAATGWPSKVATLASAIGSSASAALGTSPAGALTPGCEMARGATMCLAIVMPWLAVLAMPGSVAEKYVRPSFAVCVITSLKAPPEVAAAAAGSVVAGAAVDVDGCAGICIIPSATASCSAAPPMWGAAATCWIAAWAAAIAVASIGGASRRARFARCSGSISGSIVVEAGVDDDRRARLAQSSHSPSSAREPRDARRLRHITKRIWWCTTFPPRCSF